MAKKKSVKKSSVKKTTDINAKMSEDSSCMCNCQIAWIKLTSIAFILFLITVWGGLMSLVQKIHWGWFLGATIIFGALAMKRGCNCK